MSKTATFIKEASTLDWSARVDARLYKLSEPVPYRNLASVITGRALPTTQYVVVSGSPCNKDGQPETLIFPSDEHGYCPFLNLVRMPGSLVGEMNHEKALQQAGFSLIS